MKEDSSIEVTEAEDDSKEADSSFEDDDKSLDETV